MDITTYSQLENQLNQICEQVILKVSDLVLKNLKETIKIDVYGSHGRNKVYRDFSENDSEFYNAWEWKQVEKSSKNISREMFYAWQKMSVQPKSYIHTDYITSQDTRERLSEILNINGYDDGVGEGNPFSVQRYSYWNNFIVEMFLSGTLLGFFDSEFGKFGIKR